MDMENTLVEAWIIKYFQSEDNSWNVFIVHEFEKVAPAVEYLMSLGWMPIVESVYLGNLIFLENKDFV